MHVYMHNYFVYKHTSLYTIIMILKSYSQIDHLEILPYFKVTKRSFKAI